MIIALVVVSALDIDDVTERAASIIKKYVRTGWNTCRLEGMAKKGTLPYNRIADYDVRQRVRRIEGEPKRDDPDISHGIRGGYKDRENKYS